MNSVNNIPFIFFGTPDFAVEVLHTLEMHTYLPTLIVTSPDRPKGRGLKLTPSPTRVWAKMHSLPTFQPEKLDPNAFSFLQRISKENSVHVFIVAAYGHILPRKILEIPKNGVLNVHPSLLPKWRGASPIQSATLHDSKTGVSIMKIDEKMDAGPIVAQKEYLHTEWPQKTSILEKKLAQFGGDLLAETLPKWIRGDIPAHKQDETHATYCKKISKHDGHIDLSDDAEINLRKIRAYDQWPGTFFFYEKKGGRKMRIKITDAKIVDGILKIITIIPEGGKEMYYADFMNNQ